MNASSSDFEMSLDDRNKISEVFSAKPKYIKPHKIKVTTTGEGNRKVYETLEEAIANKLNLQPSPVELSKYILEGDPIKPVRISPCKLDKDYQYELIEGRLRYWAWVIAFKGFKDVPCLIRSSVEKV